MEELIGIIIKQLPKFIFILMTLSYSAGVNAFFVFDFDVGVSQINYIETHSQQPSLDVDISESVLTTQLGLRMPIIPNWITLTGDAKYLAPVLNSNSSKEISFLNYDSKLVLTLAGKPFHISLTSEYFFDESTPSDSTFGYEAMSGLRFAVIANIPIPWFEFNLNLYIPYWSQIEGRTEYRAAAQFNLGAKPDKKVISLFRRGVQFEIAYEYKKIDISNIIRPIEITSSALSFTLGVTW